MHPLQKWCDTGWAIEDLANAVGCSGSHVRNIIARRKQPSLGLAKRLSDQTGLAMEVFLKQEEAV